MGNNTLRIDKAINKGIEIEVSNLPDIVTIRISFYHVAQACRYNNLEQLKMEKQMNDLHVGSMYSHQSLKL